MLSERRALVTGASSGIGREFARQLAREGWSLILVARDAEKLALVQRELGESSSVLVADLATPEGTREIAEHCAQVDLLVNCAGVMVREDFASTDEIAIERTLYLLTNSVIALSRAAVAGMLKRGQGSLLNVSSRAAFVPEGGLATYGAAKAAVRSFTLALAQELEGSEVRVHLSCPGITLTKLNPEADPATAMEPEQVAREALAALQRGELVSVPGERGLDAFLARVVSGRFTAKIAGILTRLARR